MAAKRALFSKPAWAAKEPAPDKDDKPIFQQNIYEDILEARKRKEERRAARLKDKELEKANVEDDHVNDSPSKFEDSKSVKRRRISDERNDRDDAGGRSASESDSDNESNSSKTFDKRNRASTDEEPKEQKQSKPVHRQRAERKPTRAAKAALINLDDEDEDNDKNSTGNSPASLLKQDQQDQDEDVVITHASPIKQKPKPPVPDSDSDEDEELKALKKRAREEARLKKLQAAQAGSNQATPTSQDNLKSPSVSQQSPTEPTAASQPDAATPEDPEIQFSVKTMIPNCSEVIICRKASQTLDKVLSYWCQRHSLSPAIASTVFFTWNGTKLYNSTTGRSILQQIKRRHGTNPDGSDKSGGKIEIWAVTPDIFEYKQRQKERYMEALHSGDNGNIASTSGTTHSNGQPEAQTEQQPPPRQPGIVLKLVSQTVGTLNLRVRPDTTAVRIAYAFHKKMNLNEARSCYLVFDGERLDDDATVEEVGFEEEDTVDVRVVEVSQSIE